jgi:regulator of protease activity HflC (stomatin/prohibitin superfamily)
MELSMSLIFGSVVVVFGLVLLAKGFRVVQQSQCLVIERLGKYTSTLHGGFNVIIPMVDQPRPLMWVSGKHIFMTNTIDLRETVLDVEEQTVITRDNVSIKIDALLYLQITDPVKAVYEISNLPVAVSQLTQTSLRNVIGEMELDETLASRDRINAKLKAILDEATDKWGTKVNRVELKNIMPPPDIQAAMEKQMQAERERRAKIIEADGDRQARIARSEGERQEDINIASGEKEARVLQAEGEANAILKVAEANRQAIDMIKTSLGASDLAVQFLIAKEYLETFSEFVAKPSDKVYVPYEASTSLAGLGTISDVMKLSGKK